MTRRVIRGGRNVELTVREFELLEYLLRHQGQTVSRGTLALRARPSAQLRRRLICSSIVLASGTVCALRARAAAAQVASRTRMSRRIGW